MSLIALVIFLGIANWLATTILVESEVTRDYREWINRKADTAANRKAYFLGGNDRKWNFTETEKQVRLRVNRVAFLWNKLRYFVGCHLCTGTWVGLVMAAFIAPIVSIPFVGWVLTGLTIKGIGHLFLVVHKAGEAWTQHQSEQAKALAHFRDAREKVDA